MIPKNEELDFLVYRVAKVRRWLAAIAVLKTAAICLLFACGYIGGYILLDHWFNFGISGRFAAFFLLIGASVFLVYKLSHLLLIQITYTNAANFIENNYSFNQQLVAAMEYYENKADYPYSRALAEQLITRVNKDTESFSFDSLVEKWRGFALGAFIFLGMCVVGLYTMNNMSFLKTYFARLAVPFASVDPVPALSLELLTGDIVSEPESMVVMAAAIKGHIPETGLLIIAPVENDGNNQKLQLRPKVESGQEPKFESSEFFPDTGKFQYRFETGKVETQWKNIEIRNAPQIKKILADIELPEDTRDDNVLKNFSEQVKNNSIELIKNSKVTLHVETTAKLSKAELTDPSGQSINKTLNDVNSFTHTFTSNIQGALQFRLTDEKGLSSKNIPDLKITFKTDNPPQFKLVSPDGDYIATNVSSVPIEFEITDDFGLSSAQFTVEFPEGKPVIINIPIKPDSNAANFKYVLELEQYNLDVSDSIMFYAKAEDIKTAISGRQNAASSEIYFIEIRPYQQIWHIESGGGKGNMPGIVPEDLLTLLEYTRAFVKKTSLIAGKSNIDTDDRSKMDAIKKDVDYGLQLLKKLRDDPQNEFTEAHKTVLNEVLTNYQKASDNLGRHEVTDALNNEKEAYRILRKFILELEMKYNPPQSGTTIEEDKPEKKELKPSVEPPETEQERLEDELEKVKNDIEKLEEQQKQLKTNLEKIRDQQKESGKSSEAKSQSGEKNSGNSSGNNQQAGSKQPGEKGSEKSSSGQNGSGQGDSGESSSGKDDSNQEQTSLQKNDGKPGQGNGNQQNDSQQQNKDSSGQGKGGKQADSQQSEKANSESPGQAASSNSLNSTQNAQDSSNQSPNADQNRSVNDAQLKMLQAKQAQLQQEASQLKQKLEKLPQSPETSSNKASKDAQKLIDEASENMKEFQEKMNEARYTPQDFDNKVARAEELMDSSIEKLDLAGNTLQESIKGSSKNQLAQQLKNTAEQLSEDAAKMDENLSQLEREQMLARREAAKRLLESMAGAKTMNINNQGRDNSTSSNHTITQSDKNAADNPKEISRLFWSMLLDLEKKQEKPIEDEPSDYRFSEIENNFFEKAAKYNSEGNEK